MSTAERVLAAQQLDELRHYAQTSTEFMARLGGQVVNNVLGVETVTFPAAGFVSREYPVAVGALQLWNFSVGAAKKAADVFAAAAVGGIGLGAGDQMSGFLISFQAPAAAVNLDVTVTGLVGGTIPYRITVPVTGKDFMVTFPAPLPAVDANTAPAVNVPATAGGPAYSIVVYGVAAGRGLVTVTANGASSGPPTAGIGMSQVPAGRTHVVALASRVFTIYGTPGESVSFQAFTAAPRPMVSS